MSAVCKLSGKTWQTGPSLFCSSARSTLLTSLIKHKLKDKIMKNFRISTAELLIKHRIHMGEASHGDKFLSYHQIGRELGSPTLESNLNLSSTI